VLYCVEKMGVIKIGDRLTIGAGNRFSRGNLNDTNTLELARACAVASVAEPLIFYQTAIRNGKKLGTIWDRQSIQCHWSEFLD
jgi:hypothetical protein